MPIRNSAPVRFLPAGIADAADEDAAFPGACQQLANLYFDRANRGAVSVRPGVVSLTTFSGFTSPGVVSVFKIIGSRIYGLIATARTSNCDEPFCYDLATSAFVTISGVTASNVPATQGTSGDWTPPTMDLVGTNLIVTHPGFSGSNYFGVISLANPASPAWSTQNTTTNGLPSIPTAVANFNNRAWFVCGNKVYYTDILGLGMTNASQFLTLGDTTTVNALAPLPLSTGTQGVLQALIAFKDASIWQITGDQGANNLALNNVSTSAGCRAPRSIVPTEEGLNFLSDDGIRVLGLNGIVDYMSMDVLSPFTNASNRSRACAAYGNSVYRASIDTILFGQVNTTRQDYWYDRLVKKFNGPHSFAYHCAGAYKNTFILASNTVPGALFQSDVVINPNSVYTDNGNNFNIALQSSNLVTVGGMSEKSMIEGTLELQNGVAVPYNVTAYDDVGNPIGNASLTTQVGGAAWGSFVWGTGIWTPSVLTSHVYSVPWTRPVVFKKINIGVTAQAAKGVSIKEMKMRVAALGYMNR